MEPPPGYNIEANKVLLLKKAIYGLKQAGRLWNENITNTMRKLEFTQLKCEPCVFKKPDIYVCIYVDDLFIISRDTKTCHEFLNALSKHHDIKRLGKADWILGIKITHATDYSYTIDQKLYITKVLERFNMQQCKEVSTPAIPIKKNIDSELDEKFNYRDAIGCLLFIARDTRPDIMFAVARASRKVSNPTRDDVQHVKRIFRYLCHTKNYRLKING